MPPKTQYTREEIADIMRQAGWDEKLIPTYSAVAMAESSGRTGAVATRVPLRGGGYSDEYSIGLFQVNMKGKLGADRRRRFGITEKDLEDPVVNARIAKKIYDEEGWQAWKTTFQTGSYKKFLKSNEQDIGRAKVKSSYSQSQTAGADANLTGEATPPTIPLSSYSLPGWMPETRRPADVAPPQPSTPRVTVPPPPRMETPTAPGMRDIAPARTDRLSREDLTPIPSMTPPRTAPPTPRPEPPRAEGLAYVPPTVMYGTPQPEPSTGAGAGAGVSAGVSAGTGAGAGTGAETGAGVEGAVSGQPPEKPTVKGQKVRQGRGPTPGQPMLTDSKGNVYQLAPNQKNLPGGKGKRWEIVGGPQYDATMTVDGPVRGSTYIQRGQELLSEAMLNADAKAEQEYAKRDAAVAAKVSPFVVTLGGGRLRVKHLLQLTANNPTLRSRVLQQIERAGPMYAENLRQVTINPNAKDLDVPIPFALQAALELNRQGVRLGRGNSEQMIQAALNKGTLKFSGNQLVIGPQQVSALLGPTRSNRVKAAGKYVRRIASEGIANVDGQFWKDVEEEVGVEDFKSADPRLPIASNIGRREAERLEVERILRVKGAEPQLKRAYEEARAALDNPASWKGGKGYDWNTLRQVPTEVRDAMARVIAQNEAGLLSLTDTRRTINDLYKSGNPIYKQAREELSQVGAAPPPKSVVGGILGTILRATTLSTDRTKREPTDEDIQRQIQALSPSVTGSMYNDIAEVNRLDPASADVGAMYRGLLAAGRNTDVMLFGALKDILPAEIQSEWRGRLAAGKAMQEGLNARNDRTWWGNVGQLVTQATLDTPRYLLASRLGAKNLPVLFAADAMLLARGEDASPQEIERAGMMGAATGFIFQGAGKFGNWATKFAKARSAPTRAEFTNRMRNLAQQDPDFANRVVPMVTAIVRNREGKAGLVPYGTKLASGGRSFTPEEEVQILWDFFTPSDVARLTTAGEKTWKLLSKAIGPVTEVGTVYYGVKTLNSLTGMPKEESEDEALKATILHIAMSAGGKGVNLGAKRLQAAYDKMKGKIFRIFHNGKPSDVTITPDNKIVRVNQPLPRDMVDAEIVTPGGTFKVKEKGRTTIKPIRPRGDEGEGGITPPTGQPPTGGPPAGRGPSGTETPMPKRDQTWTAGRPVAGMQVVRTFVEQEGKGKKATLNIVEYTGKVLENPDGTLSVEYQTPKGTQVVPLTPNNFAASEPPTGRAKTGIWFLAPGQTMPEPPTEPPAIKPPTAKQMRQGMEPPPPPPPGGPPTPPPAPPSAGMPQAPPPKPKPTKPTRAVGKPPETPQIPQVELPAPKPTKAPKGKLTKEAERPPAGKAMPLPPPPAGPLEKAKPQKPTQKGAPKKEAQKPAAPKQPTPTSAKVGEPPARAEFRIDTPDGKTPASPIKNKPTLPKPTDVPNIVRNKGTDQETSSRDLVRELNKSVTAGITEYNDAVKRYNEALKKNDAKGAAIAKADAEDTARGIRNRLARLDNLQKGRASWEGRAAKPPTEQLPIVRQKEPIVRKRKAEEEIEAPQPPAPSKKIELEPVPGRAPKVGDTVYKPFPYAPDGMFVGKVVKDRFGDGMSVVYINPRTGAKTKVPISSEWSVNKPVAKKGAAVPAKPAPKPEAPVKTKGEKKPAQPKAEEKPAAKKKAPAKPKAEEKPAAKKKAPAKPKAEEKLAPKPKAKEEPVPAGKEQPIEVKERPAPPKRSDADIIAQKEADLQSMKDRLPQAVDKASKDKLQTRINKLQAEIDKLKGRSTGGDVISPPPPTPTPAPQPPKGGPKAGPKPEPPVKKEDKEAAAKLDPNTRAFVRDKIDKWRREEEGGMSPKDLSDVLDIPLNVIRAIPEKGELGPFGQASYFMRDWMMNESSPFLKEMIDAVEPKADITNRATAADVIMDGLAKLTGKPRSSTMGKAEWDKIYKEVLPKISDESALKLIEAAEWQSKYSQAIRALQTNPQWRSLIDGLRSDFVTSWKQIPEQTKKDLLRIARSVGADYGPRTTKTGDQANIFTNDAIIRAFDETLALRNRPIFEEGISTPNLDAFAQALSRSKEGTLSPRTSDDPTKPFVVAQDGKITIPKEPTVVGTSSDAFPALLNQYKLDKALPPQTAVALEKENKIRQQASANGVIDLLADKTGSSLKWTDTGQGILMVNPSTMALINYAQTSNPEAAFGFYFGQPSEANNIATKVAALARRRYERGDTGDLDWANKAWELAGALNNVRMSSPYRDVIVVLDVPEAPNVVAMTVMEEALHRGDIRSRWGGAMARAAGFSMPDLPATRVDFSQAFFNTKAVQRAVDNLPSGYAAYPAEAKGSEVVAKALRNDAEQQLKITPEERWAIVKAFTRLLVKNNISPQIIHENFSNIGPRADAFTEYYAQQYAKRYPVQGGGAGKVQSDVNDASLQRIWRGWSKPDGPDPAIPAKYNPQIRNEEVGGRTQTVISTPDLDGRTVERVIKHDGQYLRSPNNIEVKLNPEEIYAIERSNDFHRPYMEDNIYAANIRKLPYTIKTKDGEKEFVNIELANMADWARTATSPDTIRKILGPVGKVISTAFTGWNSTKIAIRASADLSSWRQNGKIILSAKPWYRELKETGKRAAEFNAAWDDKIAEIKERQDMMRKIMADPVAMKDNAAKGVTKEQIQRKIAALDKEIAELDKNRIPITKAMTQLRMKNLFFSHVGSVLAGVKERDWGTSIVGKMKGKKLLPRKAGDRIPAMEFFARRMWADPEYDLIVKEAGLDVGGLLRPEVGMELTDGYNTGILKRFRVDIPGTPKAPNLAAEARIAQQNPEVEIPPYEYDPKTQTWFTFVPRVKVKTGKVVPLTFEWRPFGATTQATHELFGAGFFTRAPYKESKFGRRPFKDALKSKDPKQILSWLATNARLVPFWPIKASQNAYDTSTAWVRFREMKAQLANLRAMYALEGGRPDIEVFKKAAERINRLGGAFKGDAETRVGEVVNKFIIPGLNWFMFSARWQLSIQSLFLPGQYTVAPRHVRYENIRGGLQMLGMFALGLGLAQAMADVEVVTDSPTDPGFLRIRIGNEYIGYKTIDISSGVFRYIINYARIINSFYTWFAGPPEPEGLYEAPKDPENPLSATGGIFWNWFSKTLNPRKQDIYAGLTGETVLGEPTTFTEHFLKTSVPIGVENVYDGYVDGTYAWWATSFEGVGLQVTDLPGPDQIKEAQDRDWEKYADDPDEQARRDKLWQQRYEYALRQEERNEERKFNPPTSLLDYLKQFELNEEEMLQQRKEFWERQGWTSPTPPPPSKAQELIDKE